MADGGGPEQISPQQKPTKRDSFPAHLEQCHVQTLSAITKYSTHNINTYFQYTGQTVSSLHAVKSQMEIDGTLLSMKVPMKWMTEGYLLSHMCVFPLRAVK